jgi:hypothetical protein
VLAGMRFACPGLQHGRALSIPLLSLDEDKRPVKFNGCSAPSLSVGTSALQRCLPAMPASIDYCCHADELEWWYASNTDM